MIPTQIEREIVIDAPIDLVWRIVTEPLVISAGASRDRSNWSAFRVVASVAWGSGQVISAETMRLGRAE